MFKLVNQCNKPLNRDLFITVAGNVGAGKSTLFKILMNELTPVCGDFKLGTNVNISYFHQEQKTLNLDNTIIDEIWEDNKQLTQTSLRTMLGAFLFEGEEVFKKIIDNKLTTHEIEELVRTYKNPNLNSLLKIEVDQNKIVIRCQSSDEAKSIAKKLQNMKLK